MKKMSAALAEAPLEDDQATTSRVLSVVVTVLADLEGAAASFQHYHKALAGQGFELEFVYVLNRKAHRARARLEALKVAGAPLEVIVLSRWGGEVAAIKSGVRHTRGTVCLLLPAEAQVEQADLAGLLRSLDEDGCDMAIGSRTLPEPSWGQRLERGMFHGLIRILFGRAFNDLSCRARACRRQVLDEILGHATQHQFLALLATERGFDVREVALNASGAHANPKSFALLHLGARLRLALDAVALCVVLNYVRQPFRFFGAIGLPILTLGVAYAATLAFERLWLGVALADRPALILAVLLIVLGIQVIVLGLIGEIIIFASGRRLKDYTIDRIL